MVFLEALRIRSLILLKVKNRNLWASNPDMWHLIQQKSLDLDQKFSDDVTIIRKGGRVVEGSGLENRQGRKLFVGSNPTSSAIFISVESIPQSARLPN